MLTVARSIRLYLPSLLPAADAAVLDQVIETLLAQAEKDPGPAAQELENVLTARRATRRWMERALSGAGTPVYEKRLVDVTTPPQPVRAPRYKCSTCGYVWYRRNSAEPPPCPQDGDKMTPDGV